MISTIILLDTFAVTLLEGCRLNSLRHEHSDRLLLYFTDHFKDYKIKDLPTVSFQLLLDTFAVTLHEGCRVGSLRHEHEECE